MTPKNLVGIAFVAILFGCTPYHSKFMCEKSRDYGKCTDMNGAYVAAVAGDASHPTHEVNAKAKGKDAKLSPAAVNAAAAQDLYRQEEYKQMAALLEQPAVPLVKTPTAIRTLVLVYQSGKTLYMPRYIYYLDDEANFVLGDYLNPRDNTSPMMFPNGSKKQ